MTNKRSKLVLLLFIVIIAGCKSHSRKVTEIWESTKKPKTIKIFIGKDTTNFKMIQCYENGNIKSVRSFRKSLMQGKAKYFYDDGKKWQVSNYILDASCGKFTEWYSNGNIKTKRNLLYGSGSVTDYHTNGNIWKKGVLDKFQEDGIWKTYDSLGNIFAEENYLKGFRNGAFIHYYPDGKIFAKGICENHLVKDVTFYKQDSKVDSLLTKHAKTYKNDFAWTQAQKLAEQQKCEENNKTLSPANAHCNCDCKTMKAEYFFSYQQYKKPSSKELAAIIKYIEEGCIEKGNR